MDNIELIRKKRDGHALTAAEMGAFVRAVTDGTMKDYQISAMLMAMFLRGLDEAETAALTQAMASSGDMLDTRSIDGVTADKHSTGGVGDKTTLITAPIAAALGCKIAKMSGRGLGHTGGTVDKLESIPGFRAEIAPDALLRQVNAIGICLAGQSGALAPADKKLYALRDVTATTDSLPLIASSIISKKLAAGAQCIVLDVKYGSGAFMKTPEDAESLAHTMVKIGEAAGRRMSALITNMNVPLGHAVGNALEVIEAVEILKGGEGGRLAELSLALAAEIARLCHGDPPEASLYWMEKAKSAAASGAAYALFRRMVQMQGGDVSVLDDTSRFGRSPHIRVVRAPCNGWIVSCDAEQIGHASALLGAGRMNKEDVIDPLAGILLLKNVGSRVAEGEPIAELHTAVPSALLEAESAYLRAVQLALEPQPEEPLILHRIQ